MIPWTPLTVDDVLAAHEEILPTPIRDRAALESAVAKPWTGYLGVELYPTLADKAAALLVGLARNHPFVDGNKRTALGATDYFLGLNGYFLNFSTDEELAAFVVEVAQGKVHHEFVSAWITAHLEALPTGTS